ncbi:PD40 domain-containing protein [Paracidobacterium acidisoli]|uniref:Uncharacterized protein n=1 Tax=Paracidobacterium acidisoli TaxID=2303751 RepID=A0A372IJA9_9BACT|nr:PD40 domain-containing protein [Paracidobacterium acidisoli]MBT9332960.1 hypothetical protein [Paracidobacterium acidisoli]
MLSDDQHIAIRRHLRRVLASSEFSRSGRAASFLEFVVLNALENNRESLKERAIGIAVFQRSEDWDPKLDTSVRTEARRVRKKLSEYYSSPAADPDDVNIDVPLGSYSPVFRFPEPEAEILPEGDTSPVAAVEEPSSGSRQERSTGTYLRLGLLALFVGAIGLAALQAFRIHRHGLLNANIGSSFKTLPITDEYGHQLNPAISPDGTEIAYASDAGTGTFHIIQRAIEGGTPHRLTSGIDPELSPAYSPDGKAIAFLRLHGSTTEVVVRELSSGSETLTGYIETQLGDWTGDPGPLIGNLGPAWTPDGTRLVVSDHPPHSSSGGLFILNLGDGSRQQLTTDGGSEQDFLPKVAPDGQRIAFIRASTHGHAELFILDLKTRALRQVTNEDHSINGLAWTKDPNELIVSSNREGPYQLWTVNALNGAFQKVDTDAANAIDPQMPANASWLAYVTLNQEWTIQRLTIAGPPAAKPLERFVASAGQNHSAHFSPDGRYVAFVSDRSGSWEIWLCGERCSEPQRLTNFHGPWIGGLTWSPDSTRLAFDARLGPKSAIYMMSIVDPRPQLVERNSFEERMPYWSQDGGALYFNSDRDGTVAVWKRDLQSGAVSRIGVGFSIREFGPRRNLLLGRSDGLIYEPENMPGASGKAIHLATDPVLAWTVHGSSIYYCAIQSDGHIHILVFEDGRSREIADEDIRFPRTAASLDVSPDGRYLLLTVSEHSTSNIYRRITLH